MDELNRRMMNTPDLNKERLARLKELFPDLFTAEGKLNPDELKKIVDPELVKETERFEFKWFGKSEAKRLAFTPSKAALVYDEKRSVNPELADGNLIIEGENLETLKVLLAGYREKVKIIYIDPPYNTGNDFVYKDKWYENLNEYWESIGITSNGITVDSNKDSSGRFHSNWLSMIYTRLLVARQLLKDDGAIFISIDDNEMHHLRKVCNEVFGEENFIAVFPWKKRTAKSDVPFGVSQDFEWIVAYTKGGYGAGLGYERKYYQSDDYPNDRWRLADLTTQRTAEERPNSAFNMKDPKTGKTYPYNPRRVWGVTKDSFQEYYEKGKIVFPNDYSFLNITIPAFRVFESEDKAKALLKYGSEDAMKTVSTQLPKEVGMSEDGNKELFDLFNAKVFSFPKPTDLIKYFIAISNDRDDSIILDFFAGSGTTAQAVMELNYEDGGNRKYILVQIPELIDENSEAYKLGFKKISDITIERNKRVIERMEKEESEKNPGLFNQDQKPFKTGFKVYKLAKSNFPRVEFAPDPTKTEEENLALLDKYILEKEAMYLAMLDEKNIFDEVLLKNGFMLNYTLEKMDGFSSNKVFLARDDYKECLICMEMGIEKATLKELEGYKDKIFVCLERALDTTMKWNLKHLLGDKLIAF
jgi:adenine-specific DNA-methyltransferase